MKTMLAALSAAGLLALAGCQTDTAVAGAADRIDRICSIEPATHVAFLVAARQLEVSAEIRKAEATAHAVIVGICSDRPITDTAAALGTIVGAFEIISAAYADAKEEI
ncbi:hypothetical protein Sa4125_24890 [Aureimonas sp. SA4125]|uniref:hypothetical protein n=1 Tax=Aureimonas sp. SA4125 TaxID=2826993 RepID=UPI001CC63261|nr:hypothetical protein [Aureimonas sp. SA4125]BDA84947.1 hypothetical protein Sa4125_24890 [Aureimonas sp. SA4125]